MKELDKLKEFLCKYIEKYKGWDKEEGIISSNISMYEEIINILSMCITGNYDEMLSLNILLDTLFGNKYDDLIQCIYANKKLSLLGIKDKNLMIKITKYFEEIKNECNILKEKHYELVKRLNNEKEMFAAAERVIFSFKYFQVIPKYYIGKIGLLLRSEECDDIDYSLVIESMFLYSNEVLEKRKGYRFEDKEKFYNLLSLGYEDFSVPDVSDENKLNKIGDAVIDILENYDDEIDFENYAKILPVIGVEVNDIDEFKYVLIRVLISIQNRMHKEIEMLKDEDFIMDLDVKKEIAKSCYELINRYCYIRNYMDSEVAKHEYEDGINDYVGLEETGKKNNLFYLVNSRNKCYFLSDLEDIEYEYIGKIQEYIEEFRNGNFNRVEDTSSGRTKKFREIKGDQVRIIFRRIGENDYLIYGVFIKKDNKKYKVDLNKITQRPGTVALDSSEIDLKFIEYVNLHKRKWSR